MVSNLLLAGNLHVLEAGQILFFFNALIYDYPALKVLKIENKEIGLNTLAPHSQPHWQNKGFTTRLVDTPVGLRGQPLM